MNIPVVYGKQYGIDDIVDKFIAIANKSYKIFSVMARQKYFPQNNVKQYCQTFIQHIGFGLDAWECLSMLLKKLEDIHMPLSEEQITESMSENLRFKKASASNNVNASGTLFPNEERFTILHSIFQTY